MHRVTVIAFVALMAFGIPAFAQIQPQSAEADLFFPQIADGGPANIYWQTTLMFQNPSTTSTAFIDVFFYDDNGNPLNLNFGSGASNVFSLTVPPGGLRVFRSVPGAQNVGGWAYAEPSLGESSVVVMGTATYRRYDNGVPTLEVANSNTLPTKWYTSYANRDLAVAIANPYSVPSTVTITVFDSEGSQVGSSVTLPPIPVLGHTQFLLNQYFPDLSSSFQGTMEIDPSDGPGYFAALTLNVSAPTLLTALPSGRFAWPQDQFDRIRKVFDTMLDVAQGNYPIGPVDLDRTSTKQVSASTTFNPTTIHIDYATAELVADSDAELAFIFGHELGHVVQHFQGQLFNANSELDADQHGIRFLFLAGYEPYAESALFGRTQMFSTVPGVLGNILVDSSNPSQHASFSARIDNVMTVVQALCSGSLAADCATYKNILHPDVPGALPLRAPHRGGVQR
jgi:hypothetical protein